MKKSIIIFFTVALVFALILADCYFYFRFGLPRLTSPYYNIHYKYKFADFMNPEVKDGKPVLKYGDFDVILVDNENTFVGAYKIDPATGGFYGYDGSAYYVAVYSKHSPTKYHLSRCRIEIITDIDDYHILSFM